MDLVDQLFGSKGAVSCTASVRVAKRAEGNGVLLPCGGDRFGLLLWMLAPKREESRVEGRGGEGNIRSNHR